MTELCVQFGRMYLTVYAWTQALPSDCSDVQALQSDCSDVQVYKLTYIKSTVKHRGFFNHFSLTVVTYRYINGRILKIQLNIEASSISSS